jgi:hypothetical protein
MSFSEPSLTTDSVQQLNPERSLVVFMNMGILGAGRPLGNGGNAFIHAMNSFIDELRMLAIKPDLWFVDGQESSSRYVPFFQKTQCCGFRRTIVTDAKMPSTRVYDTPLPHSFSRRLGLERGQVPAMNLIIVGGFARNQSGELWNPGPVSVLAENALRHPHMNVVVARNLTADQTNDSGIESGSLLLREKASTSSLFYCPEGHQVILGLLAGMEKIFKSSTPDCLSPRQKLMEVGARIMVPSAGC